MLTKNQYEKASAKALKALAKCEIALTQSEKDNIEVADFGLGRIEEMGLQIVTYVNTERCCAKELVLTAWQICPEHCHPKIGGKQGKEETFRCRNGIVYLYVKGENSQVERIKAKIPQDKIDCFTVFHEIVLTPGEQYTLPENTLHWFAAGEYGCVVSEFSTKSVDDADVFTDKEIVRAPMVEK